MCRFKFRVKKILENTIELNAKDYKEALKEVSLFVPFGEEKVFGELNENDIEYKIILEETIDENDKITKENREVKIFVEQESKDEEDFSMEDDEENPFNIICDKCGNHIDLSKDFK